VEYDFKLQQVDMLLAKMEVFIEAVMSQRRVWFQLDLTLLVPVAP